MYYYWVQDPLNFKIIFAGGNIIFTEYLRHEQSWNSAEVPIDIASDVNIVRTILLKTQCQLRFSHLVLFRFLKLNYGFVDTLMLFQKWFTDSCTRKIVLQLSSVDFLRYNIIFYWFMILNLIILIMLENDKHIFINK